MFHQNNFLLNSFFSQAFFLAVAHWEENRRLAETFSAKFLQNKCEISTNEQQTAHIKFTTFDSG